MSFGNYLAGGGISGASAMSSKVDESVMTSGTPTGLNGVSILLNSVQKGTPEVKNLLSNECDVVLECRVCRNLFRSVPNFIAHKRSYCRSSAVELYRQRFLALNENQGAACSEETAAIPSRTDRPERPSSTESCPNFPVQRDDVSPPESIQGRAGKSTGNGNSNGGENRSNATATKITVNFLNRLTKRLDACVAEAARNKNGTDVPVISMHSLPPITKMVPYTSFENGVQVIKNPWILDKLTSKEQAENGHANGGAADEDATVTMVVPQDPGYRLHGMSLRTRRHPDPSVAVKEISKREQELYERLASKCGQKCDLSTLQCLVCKKVFKCLDALAFHFTCCHTDETDGKDLFCFLCGATCSDIQGHVNSDHKAIATKYDEEMAGRKKSALVPASSESNESSAVTATVNEAMPEKEPAATMTAPAADASADSVQATVESTAGDNGGFFSTISVTASSGPSRNPVDPKKPWVPLRPVFNKPAAIRKLSTAKPLPAAPKNTIVSVKPKSPKRSPNAKLANPKESESKATTEGVGSTAAPNGASDADARKDQDAPKEAISESSPVTLPVVAAADTVSKTDANKKANPKPEVGQTAKRTPAKPQANNGGSESSISPNPKKKNNNEEEVKDANVQVATAPKDAQKLGGDTLKGEDKQAAETSKPQKKSRRLQRFSIDAESREVPAEKRIEDVVLDTIKAPAPTATSVSPKGRKRTASPVKTTDHSSKTEGHQDRDRPSNAVKQPEKEKDAPKKPKPAAVAPKAKQVVTRTMRQRTLKSPYNAAEYVNSWPLRRRPGASPVKKSSAVPAPPSAAEEEDPEGPPQLTPAEEDKPKSKRGRPLKARKPFRHYRPREEETNGDVEALPVFVDGVNSATNRSIDSVESKNSTSSETNKETYPVIFSEHQKQAVDNIIDRKTWSCTSCGIQFKNGSNCERHCYSHFDFVRFKCSACNNVASFYRTDLRRHLKKECSAAKAMGVPAEELESYIVPTVPEKPGSVVVWTKRRESKLKDEDTASSTSSSSVGARGNAKKPAALGRRIQLEPRLFEPNMALRRLQRPSLMNIGKKNVLNEAAKETAIGEPSQKKARLASPIRSPESSTDSQDDEESQSTGKTLADGMKDMIRSMVALTRRSKTAGVGRMGSPTCGLDESKGGSA